MGPSDKFLWITGAVSLVLAIALAIAKGPMIGISFALGVGATSAHLISLRALLRHGAKLFAQPDSQAKPTWGAIFSVASALATLPILIGAGYYVQSISTVALHCFLWGLGLVYFALVGWAIIQR